MFEMKKNEVHNNKEQRIEKAFRASEKKYRKQFEEAMDAIFIADAETGIIIDCNRATSELVDREKSELVGKHQCILHPPEKIKGEFSRTFKRHLKEEEGQVLETQVITKKGEVKDVAIKANVFELEGKKLLQGIFRDITERKRMEKERKLFEKRLSALNKHGQSLNVADDIDKILTLTLDVMEKTLGFEFADLFLVEGETLRLVAHRGFSKMLTLNLPLDGRRGVVVKAARLRKPVFIPDIRKERAYVEAGVGGMLSELAVPVKIKDKVLGVLNVENERLEAFDEKDGELLETLASYTAIAISNLKRQEKLSTLNIYGRDLNRAESLEDIYKVTLKAMEKTLGFEYASILMVEGKMLRLVLQRGYSNNLSLDLPLFEEKGVTVKAARTGKPVFVPDIRKEKTYILGKPNMLSELAVPIKVEKEVLGVLNVESKKLAAFDEEDRELLEILASHAAIAISDIKRHTQLRKLSNRLANLMESSTEIMRKKDTHQRLKVIAKAIRKFGWRRVVISLRNEKLEGTTLVTAGLAKGEMKLLLERKVSGHVWRERLGPKFQQFKIGEFYYLPWIDSWIREYVHHVPRKAPLEKATTYTGVPSRLSTEEMVDWHPQDMLYAPLRTPAGRVVGILSMDDPVDGRKPTRESLTPLELFLHQAAIVIENAQLIESLKEARKQLEAHAEQLEQKVDERTRELKKSQKQLLKAQRLAVIGELAGMVGHDLRNPLTSINGAAYYLKKRLSSKIDGKVKGMLDLIGKNIVYSNKIINDLLDYSRELKLDLTESNPKSIIKEALFLVEIPKNVQVIDLTEGKPKMKVDVAKLKRAFVNILKNAVEAMPKGGTLRTKSRKSDGNLEFVFSDTGVGISKKTIEKLWTPLFTTKAKGMGFGLAICKRIIEAHGGSISVKSSRGKGTTFTVTIPIKPKLEGGEKIWVKPLESSLLTTMKT
jgi:PAS domain S-box-containing protein